MTGWTNHANDHKGWTKFWEFHLGKLKVRLDWR